MTLKIDRRQLLQTGLLGLGALATPGAAQLMTARGFTHDVASGEPSADSVLLWTRYAGNDAATRLGVEIAEDAEFGRVVSRGEAIARAARDHCAKVTLDGLDPGRRYFYRFRAPDGSFSPVGRTKTLPEGEVDRFAMAVFSCSNMPFGWFNGYAHAAARDDIDLVVHTGDYLYEYPVGNYPGPEQAVAGRDIAPDHEIVALADYWLRYSSYRADPDLQAVHRNFPMIARWDDHEIANNPWRDGAQNHQEDEGLWEARKRAAMRAYHDWMPVSDAPWDNYQIGNLATIFVPETRLLGRDRELDYAVAQLTGSMQAGLENFRDGAWSDPSRTILGGPQEAWLFDGLADSTARGTRWQVLAQQVIMGRSYFPTTIAEQLAAAAPDSIRQRLQLVQAASQAGLPINLDAWDGYPAARDRLLAAVLEADANLVVLSGDSHNGWAFDLHHGDDVAAGVEFAGHSVTSPGYESFLGQVPPDAMAAGLVAASPDMRWCDTSGRGYMTVTLTPDEARGEWLFVDTIRERSTTIARRHSMTAAHGARMVGG
ncbi:MAG: alkaline phosphatase D family protein [Parasphingopyxis sp.]|uniref:alkaline phosphatase D family protein n=1 Tax=Parasphingopyxis sp. TaxID=1920299 RepID=UPI0032EE4C2A